MDDKPITVLIVDDDESVRKAMKRLLMSNGYKVIAFASAEDLLLSNFVWGKTCLLLDICLPGISGLELYTRLASSGVTCPVIFMTAHDNSLWPEKAEEAGAVAFLRKPFDTKSLLDAIARSSRIVNGADADHE